MFTVEYSASTDTFYIVNRYGYMAANRIPSYATAKAIAKEMGAHPQLAAGFLSWHEHVTNKGPTTVQRAIKKGKSHYHANLSSNRK